MNCSALHLRQLALLASALGTSAQAAGVPTLQEVAVTARQHELIGVADSASEGTVTAAQLRNRPLLRPAEALETVPGMIVTQHSGDGKANQYFLRGFNLDHGSDFATHVLGMPVNMASHAHGQGYMDLNFLMPELVQGIAYRKGVYAAEDGDFATTGSARIDYRRRLAQPFVELGLGQNGYQRLMAAGSRALGEEGDGRQLLVAAELMGYDGPWAQPENLQRRNLLLRLSDGSARHGYAITAMSYSAHWTATEHVPQRAIDSGTVGRFGSLDPTTGGRSLRHSLAAEWAGRGDASQTRATAWWLRSSLDLWSNFQYCLGDYAATGSCATGDQFRQSERRYAGGFDVSHTLYGRWAGLDKTECGLHT